MAEEITYRSGLEDVNLKDCGHLVDYVDDEVPLGHWCNDNEGGVKDVLVHVGFNKDIKECRRS